MEEFEEQAIANATRKPKIWKRYVDNTFTVLDRDHVNGFLQHLNSSYSVAINILTVVLFVFPWKSRKITSSLFSTQRLQGTQTVFLPTESPPTLTST